MIPRKNRLGGQLQNPHIRVFRSIWRDVEAFIIENIHVTTKQTQARKPCERATRKRAETLQNASFLRLLDANGGDGLLCSLIQIRGGDDLDAALSQQLVTLLHIGACERARANDSRTEKVSSLG